MVFRMVLVLCLVLFLCVPLDCYESTRISDARLNDLEIDGDWYATKDSLDWSSIIANASTRTKQCVVTPQRPALYYQSGMLCDVSGDAQTNSHVQSGCCATTKTKQSKNNPIHIYYAISYQDLVICTAFDLANAATTSYLDLELYQNTIYDHRTSTHNTLSCDNPPDVNLGCRIPSQTNSDLQVSFQISEDISATNITISRWNALLHMYKPVRSEHMANEFNTHHYTSDDGAFKAAFNRKKYRNIGRFFENCIDLKPLGFDAFHFSGIAIKSKASAKGAYHYRSGVLNPYHDKKKRRMLYWYQRRSSSSSSSASNGYSNGWHRSRPWSDSSSDSGATRGHWDWHSSSHWHKRHWHWQWHSSSHWYWHSDSEETTKRAPIQSSHWQWPTTRAPTRNPTNVPSDKPTTTPTALPSSNPSRLPSWTPSQVPTSIPTPTPTRPPLTPDETYNPTVYPSRVPTANPTAAPTRFPTIPPSFDPTFNPTFQPTTNPTNIPTSSPTIIPTIHPTFQPSPEPTAKPTRQPTNEPTENPTHDPTKNPTFQPTPEPTTKPTLQPTDNPTENPTNNPTENPTNIPTQNPTNVPTENPTRPPTTQNPTHLPSRAPIPSNETHNPTINPTREPTINPTSPTSFPSHSPTVDPTLEPTFLPTDFPTNKPTDFPTDFPTWTPTVIPTPSPSKAPFLEGLCCNCTVPRSQPGCPSDKACESLICNIDSFCCKTAWTKLCVTGVDGAEFGARDICLNGTPDPSISPTTTPTLSPTSIAGALEMYLFYNETRDEYWDATMERRMEYAEHVQRAVWLSYYNVTGYSLDYENKDLYSNQPWNYGGITNWTACFVFQTELPGVPNCPYDVDGMHLLAGDAAFVSVNEFHVVSDQHVMAFKRYVMAQFESNTFLDYVGDLLNVLIGLATPQGGNRRVLQDEEDRTDVIAIHVIDKSNLNETQTNDTISPSTKRPSSSPVPFPSEIEHPLTTGEAKKEVTKEVTEKPKQQMSTWELIGIVAVIAIFFALIVFGIWWVSCKGKNKDTKYSAVNRDEGEEAGGKMLPDEEHGTTAEVTYLKNTMAVDTEEEEDDAMDGPRTSFEQTDFASQSQLEAYHRTRGNTISVQKTDASVTNDTKEDDYIANDEDVKIVCDEDARGDTVSAERIDELAMAYTGDESNKHDPVDVKSANQCEDVRIVYDDDGQKDALGSFNVERNDACLMLVDAMEQEDGDVRIVCDEEGDVRIVRDEEEDDQEQKHECDTHDASVMPVDPSENNAMEQEDGDVRIVCDEEEDDQEQKHDASVMPVDPSETNAMEQEADDEEEKEATTTGTSESNQILKGTVKKVAKEFDGHSQSSHTASQLEEYKRGNAISGEDKDVEVETGGDVKLDAVNEDAIVDDGEWKKNVNVKQTREDIKRGGTQHRRDVHKRKSLESLGDVVHSKIGKFEAMIKEQNK